MIKMSKTLMMRQVGAFSPGGKPEVGATAGGERTSYHSKWQWQSKGARLELYDARKR